MKDTISISPIKEDELDELIHLCELHAQFENYTYHKEGKAKKLAEHLFSDKPAFHCLMVKLNGKNIGYTSYSFEFSTWEAGYYIHMDCLFLLEEARSKGIGKYVMNHLSLEARKIGIKEIQWQTPIDNTPAIAFYDAIGGKSKDKKRYSLSI